MNYEQLTAQQALKIAEQEEKIKDLAVRLRDINITLICIGGPLNDNKLQYSKEQLVTFWRIHEECSINFDDYLE